jgi:hypothetical protein
MDLLFQLLGIFVCIVSAGVFIVRYGIPSLGQALGYLGFGAIFVIAGVVTGKMLNASIMGLLLLAKWNLNLSFMAIGYSALASGSLGLYVAVRDFLRGETSGAPAGDETGE